jgi:O-antigen/teichoic acid export membrane protein
VRTEGDPRRAASALVFLADQAVVSGSRFLLAWSLARFSAPESYGAFALILSLLLVLEAVQQALVTWPLSVIGAAKAGEDFARYVSGLARVQMATAAALAAAAAVATLAMPSEWLAGRPGRHAVAAAALLFAQQMQEFGRRVLLTRRPAGALVNDTVSAILLLAGLLALRAASPSAAGAFTSESAITLAAVAAGVAAALGRWQTRDLRGGPESPVDPVMRESWQFGRWILGSRLGESLLTHAQNFVVGAFAGPAGVAALQAPRLLLAPLQVASFAAINYLVPRGAERLERSGAATLTRFVDRAALLFAAACVAYALVPALFPREVLGLVYRGRYDDPLLLRLWCATQVVAGVRVVLSAALYVRRRSDLIMKTVLTSGLGAVALSAALTAGWQAAGAAVAMLAAELCLLTWILVLSRRATPAPAPPAGEPAP